MKLGCGDVEIALTVKERLDMLDTLLQIPHKWHGRDLYYNSSAQLRLTRILSQAVHSIARFRVTCVTEAEM